MKSQYFIKLTTVLCGLLVSVNGIHLKRNGDETKFHNEMNSKSTQEQENLKNTVAICDMQKFEKEEEIGKGGLATVYNITRKEDLKIFVKKVSSNNMAHEIQTMSRIKGLGFAPDILCAGKDNSFFIMEKVNGNTLKEAKLDFLYNSGKWSNNYKSVPKSDRIKLFQTFAITMFSILKEIHKLNVYHGDAHQGNWMVEKASLKIFLIDFGCCGIIDSQDEFARKFQYNQDIIRTIRSLGDWAEGIGLTLDDMPSQFVSLVKLEVNIFSSFEFPTIDGMLAMFESN